MYISRCLFSSADSSSSSFFYRFTVSVIDISFKFSLCVTFSDVISNGLLMVVMMMSLSNTFVLYFMVLLSSVTDPQSQLLRKHLKLL